jgi:antiviral helicase SLH1
MKVDATLTQSKMIRVHVRRLNRGYTDRNNVYAPKFPKPQQESWFIIASGADGERLLSLQRLTLSGRGGTDGTIELEVPENYTGESVVIRVVSDGWRGVDVEKIVAWKNSEDVRDT